jgi:serine/threonine protein kinase
VIIANGTQIGPYEIVGWLGAGGMGEVYRARDKRLAREVAIKLVSEASSTDPNRLHRFEQEARAVGQLNHPNILAVYDVGVYAGAPYIVSELLEGESLRVRLQSGALPARKAIDYARQIAEGLATAHDKGIVHRDVKPDNLFITHDGRIKILDFGIAKLTHASDDTVPHTAFATDTAAGTAVGTASYMSPEQVRGETVDVRSDIFSFGSVLFEMITGRAPFTRDTAADTMAAILKDDLPENVPSIMSPALARVIIHCLEKPRTARFQSARDLAFGLDFLSNTTATAPAANVPFRRWRWSRERVAWSVAAISVIAAALFGALSLRPPAPDERTHILSVVPPPGVVLATEEAPAISPDGRQLAFVAYDATGKQLLYRRALDSASAAEPLPNTDGASLPFWSPNNQSLGFFAQGKLKTVHVPSGRLQTLADAGAPRGGTWNQDDVIVFVPRPLEGPYRIPAGGGEATQVASDAGAFGRGWFPSFLPDGKHFLIFVFASVPEDTGVFVGSLDSPARTRLVSSRSHAVYAAPGYLMFWREGTLMAQSFDVTTRELSGNAVAVAAGAGINAFTAQSLFSVSTSGTLVFLAGVAGQSELVWLDRAGVLISKPGPRGAFSTVALSPDGTRVVYDDADARNPSIDLWQLVFDRGVASRLTFHPGFEVFPLFSPDGARVTFASIRNAPPQLYQIDAITGGREALLFATKLPTMPSDWSRDGQLLIYNVIDPKTSGDIWVLPLTSKQPYAVVNTTADERYGTLSPDGRWLAYISNETGTYEVYVRSFPEPRVLRQVSAKGGLQPQWRRDGRELFYLAPDKTLMTIDVRPRAAAFDPGPAKALFATRTKWIEIQATSRTYAAAADGQRFLIANATDDARSAPITAVLNWVTAGGK